MTKLVAVSAVALLAAAGALGATAPQPQLRLGAGAPLTVHGAGFKAHERVRVTYSAERTWAHSETASAAGSFTARFAGVRFDACEARWLRAAGSLGSRAAVKLPRPSCPPAQPIDR
jgi:hypothetical protein